MKRIFLIIITVLFCCSFSFSQKVSIAQKVTFYRWNRGGEQWVYNNLQQYKINGRGDTTEWVTKDINGYYTLKILKEYNGQNLLSKQYSYTYDLLSNQWIIRNISVYTYDAQRKLLMQEISEYSNNETNVYKSRYRFAYDNLGRQVQYFRETLESNFWQITEARRTTYTDSAGQVKEITTKIFDKITNTFSIPYSRLRYQYTIAGNLKYEEIAYWQNCENPSWQIQNMKTYNYGIDEKYNEMIVSNYYANPYKITNIKWHNWDKKQMSYFEEHNWNEELGKFIPASSTLLEYPAENMVISTYSMYNKDAWPISKWVEVSRQKIIKISENNYEEFLQEWKDSSGWKIQSYYKHDYIYDDNGRIKERIRLNWNTYTNQLENNVKWVYEDFIEVVSMKDESIFTDVNIYPNPVKDYLQLQISADENFEVKVVLTDISGKIVSISYKVIYHGNNHININTSPLKPGLYLLRMETTSGKTYSYKVIKTE